MDPSDDVDLDGADNMGSMGDVADVQLPCPVYKPDIADRPTAFGYPFGTHGGVVDQRLWRSVEVKGADLYVMCVFERRRRPELLRNSPKQLVKPCDGCLNTYFNTFYISVHLT